MKTIVLTGMMGCGKSTVGKLLAEFFHSEFIDIDTCIETQESMTITETFEQKGEEYFRKIERETVKKIFKPQNQIISLGGGTYEDKNVRELLSKNALVIYLKTSPQVIFERIKTDTSRPLLKYDMSIEKIENIIKTRENNYNSAHITILTDKVIPSEIAKQITGAL
ncbi:MAG: shikimate kinase [Muribaculaceae bacterium]|nr:shikimate kinase [Muribaculaceae bacterium]